MNLFRMNESLLLAIEKIFTDSIKYGLDFPTERGAARLGIKWTTMQEAISRCKMFVLIENGGFSYEEMGIPKSSSGFYPSKWVSEHIVMREIYQRMRESKVI